MWETLSQSLGSVDVGFVSDDMSHIIRDNLRSLPDVQKLIVDNFNRLPELQQKVRDHYLNERPTLRHYHVCMYVDYCSCC